MKYNDTKIWFYKDIFARQLNYFNSQLLWQNDSLETEDWSLTRCWMQWSTLMRWGQYLQLAWPETTHNKTIQMILIQRFSECEMCLSSHKQVEMWSRDTTCHSCDSTLRTIAMDSVSRGPMLNVQCVWFSGIADGLTISWHLSEFIIFCASSGEIADCTRLNVLLLIQPFQACRGTYSGHKEPLQFVHEQQDGAPWWKITSSVDIKGSFQVNKNTIPLVWWSSTNENITCEYYI